MTDYNTKRTATKILTVTNRAGQSEPVDLDRIRKAIAFAVEDCTDADGKPLQGNKLESAFHGVAKDGMKTSDIQRELVDCAKRLFDVQDEPQWLQVAGVLYSVNYVKDVVASRGWGYDRFPYTTLYLEDASHYSDIIRREYTLDEIEEAASWIAPSRDYLFDIAGAELLCKRYLVPDELPQEAFLATALIIAIPSGDRRMKFAQQVYDAISLKKISLATPVLANLRKPGGSATSCFISSMEDSLDSIMKTAWDVAKISKNGGGAGVNISHVRATGSPVNGHPGASGGVVPWVKILNDVAVGVNQNGLRAGAVTVSIDVWHSDTLEFLELQTEAGDKRRKSYDIFPQLVIPDEFMRRVQDNGSWTLCCPYEVKQKMGIDLPPLWGEEFEKVYPKIESAIADGSLKIGKAISAKQLFVKILRTQIETGMPYLFFKDTANRANPNKHNGYIPGCNLCCESFSNVDGDRLVHSCDLASVNLANIGSIAALGQVCRIAVEILDNVKMMTTSPVEGAIAHNDLYNVIGVGAMGLADWLATRNLTHRNVAEIGELFEEFAYQSTLRSAELAEERGAYKAFHQSEWSNGKLLGAKSLEWLQENSQNYDRWVKLAAKISKTGIRNSHVTAIAPNTSSSILQGCTASVLPTFRRDFFNQGEKSRNPVVPPHLNRQTWWYYLENYRLDQRIVVDAIAEIQKWIDTGISMELIFNPNPDVLPFPVDAPHVREVIFRAWDGGCKAIYYVRTVQKDTVGAAACSGCAN